MKAQTKNCPICMGTCTPQDPEWIFKCESCGFLCSTLQYRVTEQAAYGAIDEISRTKALRALRLQNFEEILDVLAEFTHKNGPNKNLKVLDVGCAHGWFLDLAKERQFETLGIEPDPETASMSRSKGHEIREGLFPDVVGEKERFDVIIFNDVFEHLPDIQSAFKACHDHLSAGGILILNVPNRDGFFYRTGEILAKINITSPLERMWQKEFPSPHLSYFREKDLTALANQKQFTVLKYIPLKSFSSKSLWSRLRYDKKSNPVYSAVVMAGAFALLPILRFLPSDTIVGFYQKKP